MGIYDLSYQDKVSIVANRMASSYPDSSFGFNMNYKGPDLIITPWEEKDNIGRIKLASITVKDGFILGDDSNLVSMLEEGINELEGEACEYEEIFD